MKYQYDDSIIKIICGDKDNYITEKTEYQEMREKAEYKIEYQKNLQNIRALEIDEMLNDIISKKSLRVLAQKYGRDFMKNYKAYKDYACAVVLQEHNNKPLARSIIDGNDFIECYEDEQDILEEVLNNLDE